jgi:hypothetical protein
MRVGIVALAAVGATARGRRRTALFSALAALVPAQIGVAQTPMKNGPAKLEPVPMIHVLHPGAASAGAPRSPSTPQGGKVASGGTLPPSAGLIITPTFDATITSDPNAAAIENTINTAIANIQSVFSDPITVTIKFQAMTSGLGQSSTFVYGYSYSSYLASLKADAKTSADATAVALLPNASPNPVNGNSLIYVKPANLRAVGIAQNPPSGQFDGVIGLNTSITKPGSPGTSGQYSLLATVEHEINEVLGLGSALPNVYQQTGTICPEDLFRYSGAHTRSFTTTDSRTSGMFAFFSIDASASLAQFDNQNDGGDFGDWQSNPLPAGVTPKVQDAFATPGANPTETVELTALDVIGYDRVLLRPPTNVRIVRSQ